MTVKQEFTGESSNLRAEYQKIQRENQKLVEQNQKLARESEKAAAAAKSGMGGAAGAISKQTQSIQQGIAGLAEMASGWITVSTAIQAATRALETQRKLQNDAVNVHRQVANSQAEIALNAGDISDADLRLLEERAAAIREKVGFPSVKPLNHAVGAGLSTGATEEATLSAVEHGARIARAKPEDLQTYVGAALDLAKVSREADARGNLGLVLSAGKYSRPTSFEANARNMAPAIASVVGTVPQQAKADPKQAAVDAAALFSAFSQGGDDWRGEGSKTAATAFSGQLRDFFNEGISVQSRSGRKRLVKPSFDPGDVAGRLEVLNQDQKLRDVFKKNMNMEWQFKIAAEQLLEGGFTKDTFEEARKGISFDTGAFERKVSQLERLNPETRLARAQDRHEGDIEEQKLQNRGRATKGSVRKIVDAAITESQTGLLDSLTGTMSYYQREALFQGTSIDPTTVGLAALEDRERQVRRGLFSWNAERPDAELSEEELHAVAGLRNARRSLIQGQESPAIEQAWAQREDFREKLRGTAGQWDRKLTSNLATEFDRKVSSGVPFDKAQAEIIAERERQIRIGATDLVQQPWNQKPRSDEQLDDEQKRQIHSLEQMRSKAREQPRAAPVPDVGTEVTAPREKPKPAGPPEPGPQAASFNPRLDGRTKDSSQSQDQMLDVLRDQLAEQRKLVAATKRPRTGVAPTQRETA